MSEKTKPALLYVLSGLIFAESLAIVSYGIYLGVEIFSAQKESLATSAALAVTILIIGVLVFVVGRATLRARPWIRGATVTIAVLQLLLAYSILITSAPTLGWVLLVPAVALIVLVFTPPVLRATRRPDREPQA